MSPKERAIKALTLQIPDSIPTFELDFQLSQELLGKEFYGSYLHEKPFKYNSKKERERMIKEDAELFIEEAELLEHSIIMVSKSENIEDNILIGKEIKKLIGEKYLIVAHLDGTFGIPDGQNMAEFVYWLNDKPNEAKEKAKRMVEEAIEKAKRYMEGGFDGFALCTDYCFNKGPFLSPKMFSEFVTPYLFRLISAMREMGAYVIKHTDGNIMPIIDQLVACGPHALHSLDPMAGVDIKEVKQKYGNKICLIGNVNCALLQIGTKDQIKESAEYCLNHGKQGGGYIFSTSNCIFKGIPLENYLYILDIWRKERNY